MCFQCGTACRVDTRFAHQRLFAGEMKADVSAEAIQHPLDGLHTGTLRRRDPIAEQVDQLDKAVMLIVNASRLVSEHDDHSRKCPAVSLHSASSRTSPHGNAFGWTSR